MTSLIKNGALPPPAASPTPSVATPPRTPADVVGDAPSQIKPAAPGALQLRPAFTTVAVSQPTDAERRQHIRDAVCYVRANSSNPRVRGTTHKLRVRDILTTLRRHVQSADPDASLETFIGGSDFAYLRTPQRQRTLPTDSDPLICVSPDRDMDTLEKIFGTAMHATIKELCGETVPCAVYRKFDVDGNAILYVRVGEKNHLDLRVLNASSAFKTYDYVCNAGLVSFDSLIDDGAALRFHAPAHLSVDAITSDLTRGIYRMDHPLADDSIYRGWKMLAKGSIPEGSDFGATLLVTFAAFMQQSAAEDIRLLGEDTKGMPLRMAEFVNRVQSAVEGPRRLALVANAVVQLQGMAPSDDQQLLLKTLTSALNSRSAQSGLSKVTLDILSRIQTPEGKQSLALWLHMFSRDTEDFIEETKSIGVSRLQNSGKAWLRVYLPELQGYLVLEDTARQTLANLRSTAPIDAILVQPVASALSDALQPRGAASLSAVVPHRFFETPTLARGFAERLNTLYEATPKENFTTRALLLAGISRLRQDLNMSDALLEVGEQLPEGGKALKALAQTHRERAFETSVKTLATSASKAERTIAWEACIAGLQGSDTAQRRPLTRAFAQVLPEIFATLTPAEHDRCAKVLEHFTGSLPHAALHACLMQQATLLAGAKKSPRLEPALSNLVAKAAEAAPSPAQATLYAALQAFVDDNKLTRAWTLMGTQPSSWAALPGATAALLLDRVDPKLLSANVALGCVLLSCACRDEAQLTAFWRDKKRSAAFMKDSAPLQSMAGLLDATPAPHQAMDRWADGMRADADALATYLVQNEPTQATFLPAANAVFGTWKTREEHLGYMAEIWTRHRDACIEDGAQIASFIVNGLRSAASFPPPSAATLPVSVDMLVLWHAALRNCPKDVSTPVELLISTMLLHHRAYALAGQILVDAAPRFARDPQTRNNGAIGAFFAVGGLLSEGADATLADLKLARQLVESAPVDLVAPNLIWQNVHAHLFMRLIAGFDNEGAAAISARIFTTFPDPTSAEDEIAKVFKEGSNEERARWSQFALDTLKDTKNCTPNQMRLCSTMMPTDAARLFEYVVARQLLRPVHPGEPLASKLSTELKENPRSIAIMKKFLDVAHTARLSSDRRLACLPLIRAYVQQADETNRSERLAHAFSWIGHTPDAPLVIPDDRVKTGRDVAMRLLMSISYPILQADSKLSFARFRWFIDNLVTLPLGLAPLHDLIEAAAESVPNSMSKMAMLLMANIRTALTQGRGEDAYNAIVHAHFATLTGIIPNDPKSGESIANFLLDTAENYAGDDRLVLLVMANQSKATLARVGGGDALDKNIASKASMMPTPTANIERSKGHLLMKQEFVGFVMHKLMSNSPTDFGSGLRDMLNAGLYFKEMTLPLQKFLGETMSYALAFYPLRVRLLQEVAAWNTRVADIAPGNALPVVTLMMGEAIKSSRPDAEDFLTWLEVLCDRRKLSDDRDAWSKLTQQLVDAALPHCLEALDSQQTEKLEQLTKRLRTGDGRTKHFNARSLLDKLSALRQPHLVLMPVAL